MGNLNRGPYTPFSVRRPAEITMLTSARLGRPSSLFTRRLSMPSMGQVSNPSALMASMKWDAAKAVLLCAHTLLSDPPTGSLGVAFPMPRIKNQCRFTHANALRVYAIFLFFLNYSNARSGASPLCSKAFNVQPLLRRQRSGLATKTNNSGAVEAAGCPKQAWTNLCFSTGVTTW